MAEEKLSAAPRQTVDSASSEALLEPANAERGRSSRPSDRLKTQRSPTGIAAFLHPPQFVVAVILLAVTLALAQGVEFREKIPPAKSFAAVPDAGRRVGRASGT